MTTSRRSTAANGKIYPRFCSIAPDSIASSATTTSSISHRSVWSKCCLISQSLSELWPSDTLRTIYGEDRSGIGECDLDFECMEWALVDRLDRLVESSGAEHRVSENQIPSKSSLRDAGAEEKPLECHFRQQKQTAHREKLSLTAYDSQIIIITISGCRPFHFVAEIKTFPCELFK